MRRLVCYLLGHRWTQKYVHAPAFAVCARCDSVGFVMPDGEVEA